MFLSPLYIHEQSKKPIAAMLTQSQSYNAIDNSSKHIIITTTRIHITFVTTVTKKKKTFVTRSPLNA